MSLSSTDVRDRAPTSFWPLAFLLAVVAAVKPILFDTLDPDFFWHILVADQLCHDGIRPLVDRLSFTTLTTPWTPYSWLAELLMNRLWELGGYRLVLAAHALLIASIILSMVAIARQAVPNSASRAYAPGLIASAAATLFVLPWISFRPAAFVIFLLALIMWLLQRDRCLAERSRAVWLVLPLAAVAVNVHLFALLIPIWIAALLLGAFAEWFRATLPSPEAIRRLKRYTVLLFGSLLALACTPMLPGLLSTAFFYQFTDPLIASTFIIEMQPLYASLFGRFLLAILPLLAIFLIRQRRLVRAGDWLLLLVGLILLLQHGRYAPLFALALVFPLALTITGLSDRRLTRPPLTYAWTLLPVTLLLLAWNFPSPGLPLDQWLNRRPLPAPGYPAAAADFLDAQLPAGHGRLLNDFTSGGYLAWRFHGRYRVFVDGRTQVRAPSFWRDIYLHTPAAAARIIAAANADAAILQPSSPFLDVLLHQHWHPVFADDRGIVLLPPNASPSAE